MKKVFMNNRLIAIALFTVFSITAAPALQANEIKPQLPVELKYIGIVKEHVLFELSYFGDKAAEEIKVTIIDVYGNSIFSENISGTTFSKRFLLNKDEIIETPLRFVVTGRKSKETKIFEINRNVQFVEEMVIKIKE
jgi:hypothetical protein